MTDRVKKRNAKGRPITDALASKMNEMYSLLLTLERAEIDAVQADIDGFSETNCSWLAYQHQGFVRELVAEAVSENDRQRRLHRARMGMDRE
ncbi:hypothetical protein [Thioalkalivibrio sp. ALE12]|uniref:hypothetical protein n=1 Tax=Thioalkalivibrio sp. ALE12 TaxID=1158170 RepID=UPI0003752FB4|nr:hypothetical protein [Thioalkalivibrio sp. ALE12]